MATVRPGTRWGGVVLLVMMGALCSARGATNTFLFNYADKPALQADGWSFNATQTNGSPRNTEMTTGAVVDYNQAVHPGALRIPCDQGDLWLDSNNTRNSLFRSLSERWTSMRLNLSFAPTNNYQQAHLVLYQDDDNYLGVGLHYGGSRAVALVQEIRHTPNAWLSADLTATNIWLRLDRDLSNGNVTGFYSLDGTNWVAVGIGLAQNLFSPRLGIWVGGGDGVSMPNCDLRRVDVITSDTPVRLVVATQPDELFFNCVAGGASTNFQTINVARYGPAGLWWNLVNTNSWVSLDTTNGFDSGKCMVSVDTTGKAPGVYRGTLVLTAAGATNSPLGVGVTMIVNPAVRARVSPWRDAHAAAMTVWVDDGNSVGFSTLVSNGFTGTYVCNGTNAPAFYPAYYNAGMDLGSHMVDHLCNQTLDEPAFRLELEPNIAGICATTPEPCEQIISFAYPCGRTSPRMETVAGDYFLTARGYDINLLEETTPVDFMNLRSFNSHEHQATNNVPTAPPNPADFKTVVDAAIAQGKWFNMVLHGLLNDDGAIAYAGTNDVWGASAASVAKFIYQRDRTVITNYQEGSGFIQFNAFRYPVSPSPNRSFETAITAQDWLTFRVDVAGNSVLGLSTNGVATTNYSIKTIGGNPFLVFSSCVTTNLQLFRVSFSTNQPPVLVANASVTIYEGQTLTITNSATDPDNNPLTFSLGTGAPSGMTITPSGILNWTPGETAGGAVYPVSVIVADNGVPPMSATNTFSVTVLESNSPPVLTPVSNVVALAGQALSFTNTATDPDVPANTLTFSLAPGAPGGMTITPDGILNWTAPTSSIGSNYSVTVIVTDNGVPPMSASNSFVVIVPPINHPPILPLVSNQAVLELTGLVVTNTASDPDAGNILNYQFLVAPSGAVVDTNGVVTWTPTEAQGPGTNLFTVVVTDSGLPQLSATNSFFVVVLESNTPPVLFSNNPVSAVAGQLLQVSCAATDADIPTNSLTFSLGSGAPGGMAITTAGILTWVPDSSFIDSNVTVSVIVTDFNPWAVNGQHLSATNTLGIQVVASPLVLPSQADRIIAELTTLILTNTATDSEIPTNGPGSGQVGTNSFFFTYSNRQALLTDGWSFLGTTTNGTVRNTENTNPATGVLVSYDQVAHPGSLRIPCGPGDLWMNLNNTVNNLFRELPTNWVRLQLVMGISPFTPSQQANLVLYQDDDNYLSIAVSCGYIVTNGVFFIKEIGGNLNQFHGLVKTNLASHDIQVRFERNPADNTIDASYSPDGVLWIPIATSTLSLANPRIGIWAGGGSLPPTLDADFYRLDVVVTNGPKHLTYSLAAAPSGASIDASGVITWTPDESQGPSTNIFTTVVTDNGLSPLVVSNSFTVVVQEVNSAPSLPDQAPRTLSETATLVVTNTATDGDLPVNTLTYELVTGPAGASIGSDGVIRWTTTEADGPSTNVFTTVVTDNGTPPLSATNQFVVVVDEINSAPVLPVIGNLTFIGQTALIVTNTASDPDLPANAVSYELRSGPVGATIDGNGVIRWTPALNQVLSTNIFTTVATDSNPWAVNGQHLSATNTFTVVVAQVHNVPVLPPQSDRTVVEQTTLFVTNTAVASNMPALRLTYKLVGAPSGAIIMTNGLIVWTPNEAQGPSTNQITTVVTDSAVPPYSATNTFKVVVTEKNLAPVLPGQSNRVMSVASTLVVTNTASDFDRPTNSLTYSLLAAPIGSAIDTNGIISWTPGVASVGTTNVFITRVSDFNPWAQNAQVLSATNSFTVFVQAVHDGPLLLLQTNLLIPEGTILVVTNTAVDDDIPALPLTYTLLDAPPAATIETNGVITWATTEADGPGTYTITTMVSDGQLRATNSFVVEVAEVNAAPVLPIQPNLFISSAAVQGPTLQSLGPIRINVAVTNAGTDQDLPANFLTYTLTRAPSGAVIDAVGIITWVPTADQVGSTNVFETVVIDSNPLAINQKHLSATNSFQIVILAPSVPLRILSVVLQNGGAIVSWASDPGGVYRLQYIEDGIDGGWHDVVPDVTATSSTTSAADSGVSLSSRFYRVVRLDPQVTR